MTAIKGIQCSIHGFIAGEHEGCPECLSRRGFQIIRSGTTEFGAPRTLDAGVAIGTCACAQRPCRHTPTCECTDPRCNQPHVVAVTGASTVSTPTAPVVAVAPPSEPEKPAAVSDARTCVQTCAWIAKAILILYGVLLILIGSGSAYALATKLPLVQSCNCSSTVCPACTGGPAVELPSAVAKGTTADIKYEKHTVVVCPDSNPSCTPGKPPADSQPLPSPLTLPNHPHCVILPEAGVAYGTFSIKRDIFILEYRTDDLLLARVEGASVGYSRIASALSMKGISRRTTGEWYAGDKLILIAVGSANKNNALCLAKDGSYLTEMIDTQPPEAKALQSPTRYHDSCVALPEQGVAYGPFILVRGIYTAIYQKDNNLVVYRNSDDRDVKSETGTYIGVSEAQGIRRDAEGYWFIGERKLWNVPTLPDYYLLCLTASGDFERLG